MSGRIKLSRLRRVPGRTMENWEKIKRIMKGGEARGTMERINRYLVSGSECIFM